MLNFSPNLNILPFKVFFYDVSFFSTLYECMHVSLLRKDWQVDTRYRAGGRGFLDLHRLRNPNAHDTLAGNSRWNPVPESGAGFQREFPARVAALVSNEKT